MVNFWKIRLAVWLAVVILFITACSNSGNGQPDSIQVITQESEFATPVGQTSGDTTVAEEAASAVTSEQPPLSASDEEIATFIRKFYTDCVFGGKDFERYKKHFSQKVLDRMEKDYSPDGGGYAVWDFRIADVMESNEHDRVTSVAPVGDGWYDVSFINDTYSATIPVKASVKNGWVSIEDIKEVRDISQVGAK